MNAYKFCIAGIWAIVMAEDDEAVIDKVFEKADQARQLQNTETEPGTLLALGHIQRLSDDGEVARFEVYTDEIKFKPPSGAVQ